MVLPPEYAWVELVVMGAVVVFVADLIGNMITFKAALITRSRLRWCLRLHLR